jgi:MEDS: MEthanogen/methylotroph, DcmR Sensory domain
VAVRTGNQRGEPGGHSVLFYRDGDEFAGRVSAHLLEAIRAGGTALVVATREHRDAIAEALARAGADVGASAAAGRYVALDAATTMDRFMVADWPSAAGFWQVVTPLISRAAETGAPVHVFGEIVALLWDFGLVNAAIEVEAMWNELAAQYAFSLLCAYPADSVRGAAHQDALAELCRVHTAVVGDSPGGPGGP